MKKMFIAERCLIVKEVVIFFNSNTNAYK